jgi:hypothetical protein
MGRKEGRNVVMSSQNRTEEERKTKTIEKRKEFQKCRSAMTEQKKRVRCQKTKEKREREKKGEGRGV